MKIFTGKVFLLLLFFLLVSLLFPACSAAPSTTPATLSAPELKYKILSAYPGYFWCDPDFYPVAREGQEQANAIAQFSTIQSNTAEFSAIVAHLALEQKSQYTDGEKLLIYRQHKLLTYVIQMTQSGNSYNFSIRVGSAQGQTIEGTITPAGAVKVTKTSPSVNTCPICLSKGTLIDTPNGPVAVEDLSAGMPVWTFDSSGKRYAATVEKTASTPVPESFILIKVSLADGRSVTASAGHPDADGKMLGQLQVGNTLDGSLVVSVEYVAYSGATYDILPSGGTGLYRAGGVLLMSTLLNVCLNCRP